MCFNVSGPNISSLAGHTARWTIISLSDCIIYTDPHTTRWWTRVSIGSFLKKPVIKFVQQSSTFICDSWMKATSTYKWLQHTLSCLYHNILVPFMIQIVCCRQQNLLYTCIQVYHRFQQSREVHIWSMPFINLVSFNRHTESTHRAGWRWQLQLVGGAAPVSLTEAIAVLITHN